MRLARRPSPSCRILRGRQVRSYRLNRVRLMIRSEPRADDNAVGQSTRPTSQGGCIDEDPIQAARFRDGIRDCHHSKRTKSRAFQRDGPRGPGSQSGHHALERHKCPIDPGSCNAAGARNAGSNNAAGARNAGSNNATGSSDPARPRARKPAKRRDETKRSDQGMRLRGWRAECPRSWPL